MLDFWHDLKFAARMLRKNPGFAAMAILTLALGVGANAVMFSVVHTVLLKPLPYPNADRLVFISVQSFTKFTQIREQSHSLEAAAAYYSFPVSLVTEREPEALTGGHVSPEFFNVLGVSPALGRTFLTEEQQTGGANVAILSDGFWHSHFAGNPAIVGQSVVLDGNSTTIVGILPPTFRFPFESPEADVWLPRVFEHPLLKLAQVQIGAGYLSVIGRLRSDTTLSKAQAELFTIDDRYQHQFAGLADANKESVSQISPLAERLTSGLRSSLLVLLAAVGFVLLIACANVASLLLARATAREKEIAVRKALGASRLRLVRQFLAESLFLSFCGGVLGIGFSFAVMPLLRSWKQGNVPRLGEVRLDAAVLLFSLALCVATAVLFGLAPALQAAGKHLRGSLKEGVRGSSSGGARGRFRATLVVAEIAIALVLITGAGLLIQSFTRLMQVQLGFSPHNVLTFPLTLPAARYVQPQQKTQFYRDLLDHVKSLPGVEAAGETSFLPLTGQYRQSYFCAEGQICQGLGKDPLIAFWQVSSGYFETMSMPLLRGRLFDAHDIATSAPVMIVNETAAAHFWPNQNPIGKYIAGSRDLVHREVVGVVADTKFASLNASNAEQLYVPSEQMPYSTMTLVVRSSSNPEPLAAAVRGKLAELDPTIPVSGASTMEEVIAASVAQPRIIAQFISGFAAFALLLAAIGLYGVMAYLVAQRKQEMGIRISLGANSQEIFRLVLGQGMRLALVGVAVGLLASLALTRLMTTLLFGVKAVDLVAFTAGAVTLIATAFIACYLPARRATRVDPITVLRYE
jgi:putative ABC transport system permease protein